MTEKLKLAKYGCYLSNVTMSVVANITPLLFITFHDLYGISYSLLGLLVVFNCFTQFSIDVIFSAFSKRFNIRRIVRIMPLITIIGFAVFSFMPAINPENAYLWISVGTIIFAASGGMGEVLISPMVAALPSDNHDRDMSRSHSIYAWGVVAVVPVSTLYLYIFGNEKWYIMTAFWCIIPLLALIMFSLAEIPDLNKDKTDSESSKGKHGFTVFLCVMCIFLGATAENSMSQWCSGYLEKALNIEKLWGDIFGVAVFAAMLGLGRTLYAKYGSNISRFILAGFISSIFCYVTAALSADPIIGLIACGLTGFCTSMLWPGTLILTAELIPNAGVAIYALLAAGGDLGGSVGPQLVGTIIDAVSNSDLNVGNGLTSEQLGFKLGMLSMVVFQIVGIAVIVKLRKMLKKKVSVEI